MKDILDIPGNRENVERLLSNKGNLVPFVGAGFSIPACPSWSDFLEAFYQELKTNELLTQTEQQEYEELKSQPDKLEDMADFLAEKAEKREFQQILKKYFDNKVLPPEMKGKFDLFYNAFPRLKITTNYDTLIESNRPTGIRIQTFYGNQPQELNRMFTRMDENSLLKIHGDTGNPHTIVLTKKQYAEMYGDTENFKNDAGLPKFLERVFTNCTVLFIGCSLGIDRTVKVLQSLSSVREPFAILMRPKDENECVFLKRKMSALNIAPIWITHYSQIDTILAELAGETHTKKEENDIDIPHEPGVKFVGREDHLNKMEEIIKRGTGNVQTITGKLFNIDGAGGIGKTTLAIEAARRFGPYFPDGIIGPIRIPGFTPMSFAMELARRMEIKADEPDTPKKARTLINRLLKGRKSLIILDNVEEWKTILDMLPESTCSTIIVTTRDRDIHNRIKDNSQIPEIEEIRLGRFAPKEALALFKIMLGDNYKQEEETNYDRIASSLGYLPIALRQAIALLKYGPRYKPVKLAEKFEKEDRLKLLNEGAVEDGFDSRTIEIVFDLSPLLLDDRLMQVMKTIAVCRPGPVPLFFLERLSGDNYIEQKVERLFTYSWIESRKVGDKGDKYYEMHQLVRDLVRQKCNKKRTFIRILDAVDSFFLDEKVHFEIKDRLMPQMEEALEVAQEIKDKRMIQWMYKLLDFCRFRGYGEFFVRLTTVVEELFPKLRHHLGTAYSHRAAILNHWGQLDEAMVLYKKDEAICEELGDLAGLASCYGSQAIILKDWERFDEAMALFKKDEAIFEELGDRKELAASYGNQAIILRNWKHMDKAMVLLKKQELICVELGERAGLATCFHNQAHILRNQGKLDQAFVLHQKEEKIVTELGLKARLAECQGEMALVYLEMGDIEKAISLVEEGVKSAEELGSKDVLVKNLWNQGLVLAKAGEIEKQKEVWARAIALRKEMKMPTEREEKELEALFKS